MHAPRVLHASGLGLVLALLSLGACSTGSERGGWGASAATGAAAPLHTELKRTIRADQIATARARLRLDDADARQLAVSFYDTPALELFEAGLILRSRTEDGGDDDATVKVRPLSRTAVAASWFEREGFKAELDSSNETAVESCSYAVPRSAAAIEEARIGKRSIESLFSDEQRTFAREYASVEPDWTRLKVLGPMTARTWKLELPELKPAVSAELWVLPDGRQLLELSTRVPQAEAGAGAAALDAALAARGLDTTGAAETKTRAALKAFAER